MFQWRPLFAPLLFVRLLLKPSVMVNISQPPFPREYQRSAFMHEVGRVLLHMVVAVILTLAVAVAAVAVLVHTPVPGGTYFVLVAVAVASLMLRMAVAFLAQAVRAGQPPVRELVSEDMVTMVATVHIQLALTAQEMEAGDREAILPQEEMAVLAVLQDMVGPQVFTMLNRLPVLAAVAAPSTLLSVMAPVLCMGGRWEDIYSVVVVVVFMPVVAVADMEVGAAGMVAGMVVLFIFLKLAGQGPGGG